MRIWPDIQYRGSKHVRTRMPEAFQIGHLVTLLERLAFIFIGHDKSEKATTDKDLQPFLTGLETGWYAVAHFGAKPLLPAGEGLFIFGVPSTLNFGILEIMNVQHIKHMQTRTPKNSETRTPGYSHFSNTWIIRKCKS